MYNIALAREQNIPLFSGIELSAAQLLAGYAPDGVLKETTSADEMRYAQKRGLLWVALNGDGPVGFAHVRLLEQNAAHLQEIDVHPEHGRRGLGTKLIMAVCDWATKAGHHALTLTTFRSVPWNMPFYLRLGFELVAPKELSPILLSILQEEERRGLDPKTRVAMRRRLSSQ
jgi:GNAT superfamily N-acetyltransferase